MSTVGEWSLCVVVYKCRCALCQCCDEVGDGLVLVRQFCRFLFSGWCLG